MSYLFSEMDSSFTHPYRMKECKLLKKVMPSDNIDRFIKEVTFDLLNNHPKPVDQSILWECDEGYKDKTLLLRGAEAQNIQILKLSPYFETVKEAENIISVQHDSIISLQKEIRSLGARLLQKEITDVQSQRIIDGQNIQLALFKGWVELLKRKLGESSGL